MAGIYLHIPFCAKKCDYCDFVSFPGCGRDQQAAYVRAMIREIRQRSEKLRSWIFDTLFVGGGTPSVLETDLLKEVIEAVRAHLSVRTVEWTIEANPESTSAEKLKCWRDLGFNRISFGVQSFDDAQLRAVGRLHDSARAKAAVREAFACGFERVSVDLICALPGQTQPTLMESIDAANELGVSHISLYQLQLEENTPLTKRVLRGITQVPDEDLTADLMAAAVDRLEALGFLRYEVSNFAKPGQESLHNLGYWKRTPYVGFGLAAHSFEDPLRIGNTENMAEYLAGRWQLSCEAVDEIGAKEEKIMLGLRIRDGVKIADLSKRAQEKARYFEKMGLLEEKNGAFCATKRGYEVLNSLIVELMEEADG